MALVTVAPSAHALELAGVDLPDRQPPVVRCCAAREPIVVLARSRDPEREVHLARCRADGVPVVVRPSGGGAVLLAPGVVAASALVEAPSGWLLPEPYFRAFGEAVAAAVADLGGPATRVRGVSDVCVGDRKVAGSALRLLRGRVLYQVSLLVDLDVALLDRYLAHPSREPEYRAGRTHGAFVTTLRRLGVAATPETAAAALRRRLQEAVAER